MTGPRKHKPIDAMLSLVPMVAVVDQNTGAVVRAEQDGPPIAVDRVTFEPTSDGEAIITSRSTGRSATVGFSCAFGSGFDGIRW